MGVKKNRTSFLRKNCNGNHNTEIKTWRYATEQKSGLHEDCTVYEWNNTDTVRMKNDSAIISDSWVHYIACGLVGFKMFNAQVVICTDYMGSWKSNYHMITATTTPLYNSGDRWMFFFLLFHLEVFQTFKWNIPVLSVHPITRSDFGRGKGKGKR